MMTTTIVLADDQNVMRESLKVYLEQVPGFLVVGEAADGLEALDMVEQLQPDVLITDVRMPGLDGIEVTRRVSATSQDTHTLVLSTYGTESYVLEALRNGTYGYVLKVAEGSELVHAINEVSAGRHYLSPPLSERAIENYKRKAEATLSDSYQTLTTREREVLQLVVDGLSSPEVGARLGISGRTVESHRAHLMGKLGLRSHGELLRYAVERGLVEVSR